MDLKYKIALLIVGLILGYFPLSAQRYSTGQYRRADKPMVTKTTRPLRNGITFSQKERFAMLIRYLHKHQFIGVSRYAKMMGLTNEVAATELQGFTYDCGKNVMMLVIDDEKMYTLRR